MKTALAQYLALLALPCASIMQLLAAPLGTAFTYQGKLTDGGQPANGNYDLRFTIYDVPDGGSYIAGPVTNGAVVANDGLFTTALDFGEDVFIGEVRWLEVGVRTNGGSDFTLLAPRQQLRPAPYALFAPNAGAAATAGSATTVAANGVASASLQASAVTSDKIADGTIGTADIATIDGGRIVGGDLAAGRLKVGDGHMLTGSWATIAGGILNTAADYGASVGGGHLNSASGYLSTVGGGANNAATNYYATVGGGYGGLAGGPRATVGGGESNTARGYGSTVGGGNANAATNNYAAVPGGRNNLAGGEDSLAAGRRAKALHNGAFVWGDATDADFASTKTNQFLIRAGGGVGIGTNNPQTTLHVAGTVTADGFSGNGAGLTALSGTALTTGSVSESALAPNAVTSAKILDGTVTVADVQPNTFWKASGNAGTTPGAHFLGTSDNQPLELRVNGQRGLRLEPTQTNGAVNVIAASPANHVAPGVVGSVIGGGGTLDWFGVPGTNQVAANYATIGGGVENDIGRDSWYATIGGGDKNTISTNASAATIAGGDRNVIWANAYASAIGGGAGNTIKDGARRCTIGGGTMNVVEYTDSATIAGGLWNLVMAGAHRSSVGGGFSNVIGASSLSATIAGGSSNRVQSGSSYATIGGGHANNIAVNAQYATIAGGWTNTASGYAAAIGGGQLNVASDSFATVGGGNQNAAGLYGTVPGGLLNQAVGVYSLAAGRRAKANHTGAFVWADSTDADFASTTSNQFNIRATGGVRLDTGSAPGVSLNAADRALLTCGWNPFTSGTHFGLGRWGMFMEAHTLTLGMPALGGKTVQVVKYNEDSSYTSLMTVDQGGTVTATAFNPPSDRNAKENFAPVDCREVLEKVAALPISRWNFKADTQTPHLGPMAQDFHASFGLGTDDKHIATVDADGVALAAIKGLNKKLEDREAEIAGLKRSVNELMEALSLLQAKKEGVAR